MRIAVAMSGGVDSAVAAMLLHRDGHEVVGMSMHLYNLDLPDTHKFDTCCSLEDLAQARRVADDLGFPHFTVDYSVDFADAVVRPFVEAYASGETPNPCVWCNDRVKFRPLWEHARRLGCTHLATGHYARLEQTPEGPRLRRARDARKDQTYFLFSLDREQLSRTLFPLGELTKDEVRRLADEAGVRVARKPESQDICFIPDRDLRRFLSAEIPLAAHRPGRIVDQSGRELGRHDGIHRYTVGQRRGLGVAAAEPLYVGELRPDTAEVVVVSRDQLGRRHAGLRDVRWIDDAPTTPRMLDVQVRYRSRARPAIVTPMPDGTATIDFEGAGEVLSPGQAAVFYDGDTLLGGGWIAAGTIA